MIEFSRPIRLDALGSGPTTRAIEATPAECAALARRFDLLALASLTADLTVQHIANGIAVSGRFHASGTQSCVITGTPVPFTIEEPVALRFERVSEASSEIELTDADLDVLPLEGDAVDLGEATAQALGLALDPYPKASAEELAEYRRLLTSEEEAARAANPFNILAPNT